MADEKPTVTSLHDRISELEAQMASVKSHVEGSLGFKVHGRPANAPSEPDEPTFSKNDGKASDGGPPLSPGQSRLSGVIDKPS